MEAVHPEPQTEAEGEEVEIQGYQLRTKTALAILIGIFLVSLGSLLAIYLSFPSFDEDEMKHLTFPTTLEKAKKLGLVLSNYKDRYYYQVLGGMILTYIFAQTFGIPGAMMISAVSGFLFSFALSLIVSCACCALGATLCYIMSHFIGRSLVLKCFPVRANQWARTVRKHRQNLFCYILFVRITPILPNWFVNMVSAVVGVPLHYLSLGTLIGVIPPVCVWIQAGTTLQQLTTASEAITYHAIILIVAFALLSLLPVVVRERRKIMQALSACPHKCESLCLNLCCLRCRQPGLYSLETSRAEDVEETNGIEEDVNGNDPESASPKIETSRPSGEISV